jgi:hypothetical protein
MSRVSDVRRPVINPRNSRRGLRSIIAAVFVALLLGVVLMLAACGVPANTAGSNDALSAASTASSGRTPVTANPPANAVSLSSDHASYTPSSTIIVTLSNTLATSVRTFDHQTSCSIVTLQRQTTSGWSNVGGCALMIATRIVDISAGETRKIALSPGAGQIHATPWPTGMYRVILHYALPGQDMSAGNTATTPTFTIS